MASPTTWQRLIEVAMAKRHETFSDLESCTLTSAELMTVFDAGSGATEGTEAACRRRPSSPRRAPR